MHQLFSETDLGKINYKGLFTFVCECMSVSHHNPIPKFLCSVRKLLDATKY